MKNLLLIIALVSIFATGCEKNRPVLLSDFIVGTWQWERNSLYTYEYTTDGKQIAVHDFGPGALKPPSTRIRDYHVNDLLNTITILSPVLTEYGMDTIETESLVIWSEDDRGVMIFQHLDNGDIYKYLRLE
jgi:hypothetical protein